MTTSERLAELRAELVEVKAAISYVRKGGQSYTITSGSSGTSRTVTQADYRALLEDKKNIERDIANLSGTRAVRMRAGW